MAHNAECAICERTIPSGDSYGRVDLRLKHSERARDRYGLRKHQLTSAVLTGTVCKRCLMRMALRIRDEFGLELREGVVDDERNLT